MIDIEIKQLKIELHNKDIIELVYIPDQTQTLVAGREYRFLFTTDTKIEGSK